MFDPGNGANMLVNCGLVELVDLCACARVQVLQAKALAKAKEEMYVFQLAEFVKDHLVGLKDKVCAASMPSSRLVSS